VGGATGAAGVAAGGVAGYTGGATTGVAYASGQVRIQSVSVYALDCAVNNGTKNATRHPAVNLFAATFAIPTLSPSMQVIGVFHRKLMRVLLDPAGLDVTDESVSAVHAHKSEKAGPPFLPPFRTDSRPKQAQLHAVI
jgi:hypothetical protein